MEPQAMSTIARLNRLIREELEASVKELALVVQRINRCAEAIDPEIDGIDEILADITHVMSDLEDADDELHMVTGRRLTG